MTSRVAWELFSNICRVSGSGRQQPVVGVPGAGGVTDNSDVHACACDEPGTAQSPSKPQILTRWVLSPSTCHKGANRGAERASPSLKGTRLARRRAGPGSRTLVYALSCGPIWPLCHREGVTKRTCTWVPRSAHHENGLKWSLEAAVTAPFPDPHREKPEVHGTRVLLGLGRSLRQARAETRRPHGSRSS